MYIIIIDTKHLAFHTWVSAFLRVATHSFPIPPLSGEGISGHCSLSSASASDEDAFDVSGENWGAGTLSPQLEKESLLEDDQLSEELDSSSSSSSRIPLQTGSVPSLP